MNIRKLSFLFIFSSLMSGFQIKGQQQTEHNFSKVTTSHGYYKDVFVDGGIKLTSMKRLPAAVFLNLSVEYFTSQRSGGKFPPTKQDSILQRRLIVGSEDDINGVLLYPDGEPRFRMIYCNGGKAAGHGKSLTAEGINRFREYVNRGGSYVGSCAGAFIASKGSIKSDSVFLRDNYMGIWPGITRGTGLTKSYTGVSIEENSPLLKYFDFGGDMYIDSVRHNGGCFAYTNELFPVETEVLLRYHYPKKKKKKRDIHNEINTWAYKKDNESGRVVVTGSHPEFVAHGERLHLTAALLLYALEGNGKPKIKAELKNNKIRKMYKSTLDAMPDYTMIGDKQYHHFIVDIPKSAKNISVKLEGPKDFDLFLYMNKDDFAFRDKATYIDISLGAEKSFMLNKIEPGRWFISVECDTTVETVKRNWGEEYVGKTEVLNGVPYNIIVKWDK